MKKLLMIAAIILISITAKSQRTEDCRTKICFFEYRYGNYILLVVNKMNVATSYSITWPDGVREVFPEISAGGSAYAYHTLDFIPGMISVQPTQHGPATLTCPYAPVTIVAVSIITNKRC